MVGLTSGERGGDSDGTDEPAGELSSEYTPVLEPSPKNPPPTDVVNKVDGVVVGN